MTEMRRGILIAISIAAVPAALLAYGPTGHEIVGGIADKLVVNTPAGEKIYTLTDGITLERASVIADEIKAWDKNGVDDPNAFPHYPEHAKIDKQLRDFWRGNPPTQDSKSHAPSQHWFHYTDVPILNLEKYSDGETGRSQWDIVHMISYCVDVLRGEIPEDNPRKITRRSRLSCSRTMLVTFISRSTSAQNISIKQGKQSIRIEISPASKTRAATHSCFA